MATLKGSHLRPIAALVFLCIDGARAEELYPYGEYLSGECLTCHRLDSNSSEIPAIFGWPEDKFIETLAMYKYGSRENAAMRNVAMSLGDEEMAALARFFASQTPQESAQ
jgi:cytochrome c553